MNISKQYFINNDGNLSALTFVTAFKELFFNYDSEDTEDIESKNYIADFDLFTLKPVIDYPKHVIDLHAAENERLDGCELTFLEWGGMFYHDRVNEVFFLDQLITIPDKKVMVLCCVAYDIDDPGSFATFAGWEGTVPKALTSASLSTLDTDTLSSYNQLIPDLPFDIGRQVHLENGNLFSVLENDNHILVCYETESLALFNNLECEVLKRKIQNTDYISPENPPVEANSTS